MIFNFILFCILGFLLAWVAWLVGRVVLVRSGWLAGKGPCLKVYRPLVDQPSLLTQRDAARGD